MFKLATHLLHSLVRSNRRGDVSSRLRCSCRSRMISWERRNGLVTSGWRPWAHESGSFRWSRDKKNTTLLQASYEDLRPGLVPCCLLMIPPAIIFAPCVCPILSVTSKAYRWTIFCQDPSGLIDCQVEEKQFFSSDSYSLRHVTSVEIIQRSKAHTGSEYDGSTTTISITTQHIFLHHSQGIYEFPEIPIDHHAQAFVHEVQSLLNQPTLPPPTEAPHIIYPAESVAYDSQPLLVQEAVVIFSSEMTPLQRPG